MTSIQGIYIALYGRPADPAGLAYYTAETNGGTDLSAIGDLSSVPEYQDRFADMSSEEIVTSIYESLFERAPDAEGLAFYVSLLEESSANINRIAIDILNGAQNEDLATINAKIEAADLFTMHLDTDAEVAAYQGDDAAQVGRDYISDVNASDAGTGEEADAAILKLFSDEGQQPGQGGGNGGGGAPDSGAGPDTVAPVITSAGTAEVDENSEVGTVFYTAAGTDNRSITSFALGEDDESLFSINAETGEVSLDFVPDAETQDTFAFEVTAFDNAGNSDTQTVSLSINDLPETTRYNLTTNTYTGDDAIVAFDASGAEKDIFVISGPSGSSSLKEFESVTVELEYYNYPYYREIDLGNTGSKNILEFDLNLGTSVDLDGSTDGTALLRALGLENSFSLGYLEVSNQWDGYLVAYQDSKVYVFEADAGNNDRIFAGEISLVGVAGGVSQGDLTSGNFETVATY